MVVWGVMNLNWRAMLWEFREPRFKRKIVVRALPAIVQPVWVFACFRIIWPLFPLYQYGFEVVKYQLVKLGQRRLLVDQENFRWHGSSKIFLFVAFLSSPDCKVETHPFQIVRGLRRSFDLRQCTYLKGEKLAFMLVSVWSIVIFSE